MYSINTRAPFIWFGLDWLEEFYVRHSYKGSELGAPLTNQHFYISKIYKDTAFFKSWNAQPNSPSPEYDQHTKRYIEARNGIGHVFDISHYRQFYWLNNLLRNEPLYHGTKNLYKIDSLIRFLHTTFETNKQMIARYSQEGKTSVWLANCTKGNLLGYDFLAPIYPDWDFCPLQYSDGQIDSFLLLKKHLQTFTIPPTLLYFKKNSVCGAYNWYNYALAIWLEYVDDIPQVTGAQIITPRRVYFYNCPHSLGYAQTGENSF